MQVLGDDGVTADEAVVNIHVVTRRVVRGHRVDVARGHSANDRAAVGGHVGARVALHDAQDRVVAHAKRAGHDDRNVERATEARRRHVGGPRRNVCRVDRRELGAARLIVRFGLVERGLNLALLGIPLGLLGLRLRLQVIELSELGVSLALRSLRLGLGLRGLLLQVGDTVRDRVLTSGLRALGRGDIQRGRHRLALRAQRHVGGRRTVGDRLRTARGQGHGDRIDVAFAVLTAHQIGDRALSVVGLCGGLSQRLVDAVLLALGGIQLAQDRRVLARLRVVDRGRGLVGGLRHRNLPVESLQVDENLSQRRVDALQLRLQGVDRCLGLGGCVRGGVALVVGASRHRLTHRREARNR